MSKLKNIISLICVCVVSFVCDSQVTDTVKVGYTKTAYLLFSDSTIKYDVGSEMVIVRHARNKIILQAEEEGFEETNLMVEVSGKIYLFIIQYEPSPTKFLYDYTIGEKEIAKSTISKNVEKDSLKEIYRSKSEQLMKKPDRILNRGVIKYKVNLYLRDMVIENDKMFLEFEVVNNGNIPYVVDFYQFKVKSVKRRVKGESFQEVELYPVAQFNRPLKIEGKSTYRYVVVLDKFALTEKKKLVIEHWEDNGKDLNIEGGRKINFDITSKDVLNVGRL